ncbi:MAG: hypothetical protein AMXMBFR81_27510 [Chthonomonas sp.]
MSEGRLRDARPEDRVARTVRSRRRVNSGACSLFSSWSPIPTARRDCVGCVAGALDNEDSLARLSAAGFVDASIEVTRRSSTSALALQKPCYNVVYRKEISHVRRSSPSGTRSLCIRSALATQW